MNVERCTAKLLFWYWLGPTPYFSVFRPFDNFQIFFFEMDYYCDQKYNFLQSKPYLQKFFARRSEMDNNGKSVSITLSWYQYWHNFCCGVFPLAIYLIWSTVPPSTESHSQVSEHFLSVEELLTWGAWHPFHLWVFIPL